MGDLIHLANLPQDIILRIVNVTGHAFMEPLRLISPLWGKFVINKYHARTDLPPPISLLRISSDKIRMGLSRRHLCYFGVDSWTTAIPADSDETVMVGKFIREQWIDVNNRPKKIPINWDGIIDRIARRFEKCSHLDQIQFDGNFTKIREINEAIGDIVVNKCNVLELGSFELNIATNILTMLRSHSVQYLTLGFVNIQWNLFQDNLASFFAEAIQIVPTIVFEFNVKTRCSYMDERRSGRWDARQREIMKQTQAMTWLRVDPLKGRFQNDVEIRVRMGAQRI